MTSTAGNVEHRKRVDIVLCRSHFQNAKRGDLRFCHYAFGVSLFCQGEHHLLNHIAVNVVVKGAAANHYIDTLPVLNITIPRAKKQDDDRQVKKNWLRDDELRTPFAEPYRCQCRSASPFP